jgi:hypothetical protein
LLLDLERTDNKTPPAGELVGAPPQATGGL